MYVIVEIAGLQYKVEQDQQIFVNRLQAEEGDVVAFDRVMLSDNGSVVVGAPVIEGMVVEAKVLEHLKGDKVIVFKKKRRKGYKVKNGYRSSLTKIEIVSIGAGKGGSKKTAKKEEAKAAPSETKKKTTATKESSKKETPVAAAPKAKKAAESTTEKKAPTKKPAAKKASAKGDDLTKVEGIGPKVKGIFNEAGIVTFADLAAKTSDELKEILTPHGGIYAGMTTDTWPQQAKLAAEGKWDELAKWQDELDGGKA